LSASPPLARGSKMAIEVGWNTSRLNVLLISVNPTVNQLSGQESFFGFTFGMVCKAIVLGYEDLCCGSSLQDRQPGCSSADIPVGDKFRTT